MSQTPCFLILNNKPLDNKKNIIFVLTKLRFSKYNQNKISLPGNCLLGSPQHNHLLVHSSG